MVSSRKLVYDFVRKYNSYNTGVGQSFRVIDIVATLNDAYEIIIENYVNLYDLDQRYRNALRELEKKNVELKLKKLNDTTYIAKYPKDLYKRLNQISIVTKDCCPDSKRIIPRFVQSDDLWDVYNNPYTKPSFEWGRIICDEGEGGLYLYTDGEMSIDNVFIDYIRKINYIQAPSLLECADNMYLDYDDKIITNDVNFDISNVYLARKVVDVAVFLASTNVGEPDSQNRLNQIIQLENIK